MHIKKRINLRLTFNEYAQYASTNMIAVLCIKAATITTNKNDINLR